MRAVLPESEIIWAVPFAAVLRDAITAQQLSHSWEQPKATSLALAQTSEQGGPARFTQPLAYKQVSSAHQCRKNGGGRTSRATLKEVFSRTTLAMLGITTLLSTSLPRTNASLTIGVASLWWKANRLPTKDFF